jgi:hypothetical protein
VATYLAHESGQQAVEVLADTDQQAASSFPGARVWRLDQRRRAVPVSEPAVRDPVLPIGVRITLAADVPTWVLAQERALAEQAEREKLEREAWQTKYADRIERLTSYVAIYEQMARELRASSGPVHARARHGDPIADAAVAFRRALTEDRDANDCDREADRLRSELARLWATRPTGR